MKLYNPRIDEKLKKTTNEERELLEMDQDGEIYYDDEVEFELEDIHYNVIFKLCDQLKNLFGFLCFEYLFYNLLF